MNDQQKVQLLPCPFCGGKAKTSRKDGDERIGYNHTITIACDSCGSSLSKGSGHDKSGWCNETAESTLIRASDAWNTRQAALAHASSASAEECSVDDHVAGVGKLVAACCGRSECGGECGNEWQGMIHADGFLAGIRDDGTVSGYAIETHYIPAKGFIDHGDFLAIVMDDNGCDAETRVTKSNLRHALGDSEHARPAASTEEARSYCHDREQHRLICEDVLAFHKCMDELGIPRDHDGKTFSMFGRATMWMERESEKARSEVIQSIDQAIAGRRGDGNG